MRLRKLFAGFSYVWEPSIFLYFMVLIITHCFLLSFQLAVAQADANDLRIDGAGFGPNPPFLSGLNNPNALQILSGTFPVDPTTKHMVNTLNSKVIDLTITLIFNGFIGWGWLERFSQDGPILCSWSYRSASRDACLIPHIITPLRMLQTTPQASLS